MVLADSNTEDSDKSIPFFYILNGFLFIADSAILLLLDLSAGLWVQSDGFNTTKQFMCDITGTL